MAKDSKKKGKDARAAGARGPKLDGQGPRLDAKLAKVVAKRVKKLRVQLAAAARREQKKVRALDKAHRRRQLLEAAIDELSFDVASPAVRATQPVVPALPPQPAPAAASPARGRKAAPPKA